MSETDFHNDTLFDLEDPDSLPSTSIGLDDVLSALQTDPDNIPEPEILYGLSGLTSAEVDRLKPVWEALDSTYRRVLLQMLVDISEADFMLDYDAVGFMSLRDDNADVRKAAVEVLWENDTHRLMHRLIEMAQHDPSDDVRAEATRALGRYVLKAELGELSGADADLVKGVVADLLQDGTQPVLIQQRALESLAHCGHPAIAEAIESAYDSSDDSVQRSAVIAMGRTCDKRWEQIVMSELENSSHEMRYRAVIASGELQLELAVPVLSQMLLDEERDIQRVAIAAMGEIGSKEAVRVLNAALDVAMDTDDDALIQHIEDALGTASLMQGDMMLMDIDLDEVAD